MRPPPARVAVSPRVFAFFYPWWGTWVEEPPAPHRCSGDASAWLADIPGRGLVFKTAHTPIRADGETILYQETACWSTWTDDEGRSGEMYDVTDPLFVREQMRRAREHGIDGFAVSTHGDNPFETRYFQETVLDAAAAEGFRAALLYEAPEKGWTCDDQTDARTVAAELSDLLAASGHAEAWATAQVEGESRRVVFVDPLVVARFPSADVWASIRDEVDRAGTPSLLVGGALPVVFAAPFEGAYRDLDVFETMEGFLGEPPHSRRDERRLAYRAVVDIAGHQGMLAALPVVPGWAPIPLVPGEDAGVVARDYGAPGDFGAYYRLRWEDALEAQPDWIVITSWNEWVEGTEIEPSREFPPSRFDFLRATALCSCALHGNGCPCR